LFRALWLTAAILLTACAPARAMFPPATANVSIPVEELAVFAALVARDRACIATSPQSDGTYISCIRERALNECEVARADWEEITAYLNEHPLVADGAGTVRQTRDFVAARCAQHASPPRPVSPHWRVTDRCETTAPFLRAKIRSRWIGTRSWSADHRATENGRCQGNLGVFLLNQHCRDYSVNRRHPSHPAPALFGFEASIGQIL
jgi:hypothetical protein